MNHLIAKNRSSYERVLWLCMVFLAMAGATHLSLTTWEHYQNDPTVISMDRNYRDWNTTFPSVTICPSLKYDNLSVLRAAKMVNGGQHTDVAIRAFEVLAEASYENFDELGQGLPDDLLSPDKYMEYIINNSFKFKFEYIENPDAVREIVTEMGLCYSVHSQVTDYFSPVFLWPSKVNVDICSSEKINTFASAHISQHTGHCSRNWWKKTLNRSESPNILYGSFLDGGPKLKVVRLNSGAKIYVHNPHDLPDSSSHWKLLEYGEQIIINVVPLSIFSTDRIKSLKISQRKCRFPEESDLDIGYSYSYNLCRMQCRIDQAMATCGCIPHFYRTRVKYPVCSFKDWKCLGENKMKFIRLRTEEQKFCSCLAPCDDVNYGIYTKTPIKWKDTNVVVEIPDYPRMRLRRDLLFGFSDLLVAVGGTGGLFLGCSVLSLVEIVYFFTVQLFVAVYRRT